MEEKCCALAGNFPWGVAGKLMAMSRPRRNFGERPKGWKKVNLELPELFADRIQEMRDHMPTRSMKLLGTAAFAAFLVLPPALRRELWRWAHRNELDPDQINLAEVHALMLAVLAVFHAPSVPPTESKAKKVDPKKPRPGLPPGTWEVVYPAKIEDGVLVQVIVQYSEAKDSDIRRPEDKRADGDGEDEEKGAA